MKTLLHVVIALALTSALVPFTDAASVSNVELTAAIQAIQQAPDPSAAVAAYANGTAVDRNSAAIQEAYVARMIDFGMPELAYRQARTLTGLAANNGLAWGVLAYVDARRGDMSNAVPALVLAGQFAPEHPFVQRTAGEIIAWADLQDAPLPAETKTRLDRIRSLLTGRPAYIAAYDTARKAYLAQRSGGSINSPEPGPTTPGLLSRPPLVETNAPQSSIIPVPIPLPSYDQPTYGVPEEPIWIEPDPIWWWRPVGYFSGVYFVAAPCVFVAPRHPHGGGWHNQTGAWTGRLDHHSLDYLSARNQRANWHTRSEHGHPAFFGVPAQPAPVAASPGRPATPSWGYLSRSAEVPSGTRYIGSHVTPSPIVSPGSPVTSWSALEPERRSSFRGSSSPPPGGSPGKPSWSALSPRNSSVSRPSIGSVPSVSRPSWSILGTGSSAGRAAPAPAAPTTRSSGGSRGAPSWSASGHSSGKR